ncbi:unnamed protein product [Cladocopium goreaui]|uniref:Uncharacterized protein n=1 Tax=Cladocopium goreaui TaxID=2562237 RepID=A0A9P1DF88_9DINO|nr:unnamed protein product [Cladocopium goreaui]
MRSQSWINLDLRFFRATPKGCPRLGKAPVLHLTLSTEDGNVQAMEFIGKHQRQYYAQEGDAVSDALAQHLTESLLRVALEFVFHPSRSKFARELLVVRECSVEPEALQRREELLPRMLQSLQRSNEKVKKVILEFGGQLYLPSDQKAKSFVVLDEDVLKVVPAKEQVKAEKRGETSAFKGFNKGFLNNKVLRGPAQAVPAVPAVPERAPLEPRPVPPDAPPVSTSSLEKRQLLMPAAAEAPGAAMHRALVSTLAAEPPAEPEEEPEELGEVLNISQLASQLFGDAEEEGSLESVPLMGAVPKTAPPPDAESERFATNIGSGAGKTPDSCWLGVVENVEHFICVASPVSSGPDAMIAQLLEKRQQVKDDYTEVCLVSSPGFAVLDSGCGKTIIGSETLAGFKKILSAKGIVVPPEFSESNTFKYGNGETEVSNRMVKLPICLAGRRGSIHAAVVKGQAPLLMSRVALKSLEAEMNFGKDQLIVFTDRVSVPLTVNSAGQYTVNVSNFAKISESAVNDDDESDLPMLPEPSPAALLSQWTNKQHRHLMSQLCTENSQAARELQDSQNQPAPEGIFSDVESPPSAPVEDTEMPEAPADENVRVVPPTGPESESHAAPGDGTNTYGPLRRKVLGKSGPQALYRPAKLKEDDFAEIMREIVPDLIEQTLASESSQSAQLSETERSSSVKRALSPSEVPPSVNPKSQRLDEPDHALCVQQQSNEGVTFACDEVEVLSVAVTSQHADLPSDRLEDHEKAELRGLVDAGESPEAFDLLRACIRVMRYQISPEESVLKWRAKERERRKQFATRAVCSTTSHVDQPLSSHGD